MVHCAGAPNRIAYIPLVEDDQVPSRDIREHMDLAKHYGVVQVALFHMKQSNRIHRQPDPRGEDVTGRDEEVPRIPEKALKGNAVDCKKT